MTMNVLPFPFNTPTSGIRFGAKLEPHNRYADMPGFYNAFPTADTYGGKPLPQPKKSGLFSKLLKGVGIGAAALLGGIAFKRYAPQAAQKVGSYVPNFIHSPLNKIADSGVGKFSASAGNQVFATAENLFGSLKHKIFNK